MAFEYKNSGIKNNNFIQRLNETFTLPSTHNLKIKPSGSLVWNKSTKNIYVSNGSNFLPLLTSSSSFDSGLEKRCRVAHLGQCQTLCCKWPAAAGACIEFGMAASTPFSKGRPAWQAEFGVSEESADRRYQIQDRPIVNHERTDPRYILQRSYCFATI